MNKKGYKNMVMGIPHEQIERAIDAYVHSPRDRKILKLCLLHGQSYTKIAGRLDLEISSRSVQEVMNRWMPIIKDHL